MGTYIPQLVLHPADSSGPNPKSQKPGEAYQPWPVKWSHTLTEPMDPVCAMAVHSVIKSDCGERE